MKHLKMVGLALLAAAALTAVIGAGTASATVICKNNLNTEKCSEPYPVETKGKASLAGASSARLETTGGTVLDTCTGNVIQSSIRNAGSATTTVESVAMSMTWNGCTNATVTLALGEAVLHHIAGTDNGTLTTFGSQVTVSGIFGSSCTYGPGNGTDMGTTVGGNPGSMTVNAIMKKQAGSSLCPAETRFTGEYVATEPTAAWVAAG